MCIVICIHTCNHWHPFKCVIKPLMQMPQCMSRNAGRVRTFRVDTGRQMQMQHLRGIFSYLARNVSNMPKSILVLDCLRYIKICKHMDVYGVFWFNPWTFVIYAGRFNIMSTNWNTKKTGSLVFFSGFLPCFWNANGSEMTLKWLFDLALKLSHPYDLLLSIFYNLPPVPNLNSMHGGHTKDHAGPAHGAAASLWGCKVPSEAAWKLWWKLISEPRMHPMKLRISPEILPCHKESSLPITLFQDSKLKIGLCIFPRCSVIFSFLAVVGVSPCHENEQKWGLDYTNAQKHPKGKHNKKLHDMDRYW